MKEKYNSLMANNTWEMKTLPIGKSIIECMWVFDIKMGSDGNIHRFKARLVASSFTQREGIDYVETFPSIVKYDSIKTMLLVAAGDEMHME